MAALTGAPAAVAELLAAAELPQPYEIVGPVSIGGGVERALVRVGRAQASRLAPALKAAVSARSARKASEPVKVMLDPLDLF